MKLIISLKTNLLYEHQHEFKILKDKIRQSLGVGKTIVTIEPTHVFEDEDFRDIYINNYYMHSIHKSLIEKATTYEGLVDELEIDKRNLLVNYGITIKPHLYKLENNKLKLLKEMNKDLIILSIDKMDGSVEVDFNNTFESLLDKLEKLKFIHHTSKSTYMNRKYDLSDVMYKIHNVYIDGTNPSDEEGVKKIIDYMNDKYFKYNVIAYHDRYKNPPVNIFDLGARVGTGFFEIKKGENHFIINKYLSPYKTNVIIGRGTNKYYLYNNGLSNKSDKDLVELYINN